MAIPGSLHTYKFPTAAAIKYQTLGRGWKVELFREKYYLSELVSVAWLSGTFTQKYDANYNISPAVKVLWQSWPKCGANLS